MNNLCNICPRSCNISRDTQTGFCKASNKVKVSKVMLHFFEEPPISGLEETGSLSNGSGTIFFSNCTLKCCYCQNSEISTGGEGKEISITTLADIFKQLENAGADSICVKDMAGLLTPYGTYDLVKALKETVKVPLAASRRPIFPL